MKKWAIVALALLAGAAWTETASAATSAEKAACKADAMKLCASKIGRPAQMNACLASHKAELSQACREVVEAHGG